MTPTPEESASIKWHGAADLTTTGGSAEAKTRVRKFAQHHGGTIIALEPDEMGQFRSTVNGHKLAQHMDATDPEWSIAPPFHIEVDSVTGNTPPRFTGTTPPPVADE